MSKLLYATDVPFKPSRLTRLSVLSMVLEWCTASWLSSHTADDVGCGKTLNTVLKNPQLVPGAYVDEIFFRVPPCPCPPSAPKDLSPPGPGISVMSYTETRESPVQGGSCASPVKGSRQRSHGDDTAACISDESDADTAFEAHVDGEDKNGDGEGFEHRRPNTYDNQRFEMGQRAPLVPPKRLRDLPPIPTEKLSRKTPPLKRVLSRVFSENGADVSLAPMTNVLSKAQHDFTHRHDLTPLADSQGTSNSSYDDSSAEVPPSPNSTNISRLPGVVTVTDVFEHPTHSVTRTVIRPSPSHSLFSLPFKRSSLPPGPKSGSRSRSLFGTPESTPVPDARSAFEEELDASLRRWEDEREGHNAMDVYVVIDREASHEESWRSLVQEVHYNYRPPSKKLSSECGRW